MSSDPTAEWEVVRHPRARTLKLSLDPVTGRARLTLPRRAALKPALAWAQGKADWLADQRARLPTPRPFVDGAVLTVAGDELTIAWSAGPRRTVLREGDRLLAQGPAETLGRRVELWLRREALRVLSEETAAFAAKAGVTVAQVAVGDPRGRWGSCAGTGVIRYSWRLILAPGFVRRATVAHEVAHRVHMNHGPAFHALDRELLGTDPAPARAWLRSHGAGLHWFGRSSG
ncbi:M48 family metallopeptidase [Sphingomonas sp.]|uniref:M48 family metallopeptidase n=1 Tax=Sphingomonas sp. TaxID=28214 RepID=UPI003B00E03B